MAYYLGASPDICPQVMAPVCGVNGKTYGNSCMAEVAGVAVASVGPCPGGSAGTDSGSDSGFPWMKVILAAAGGFVLGRYMGGR